MEWSVCAFDGCACIVWLGCLAADLSLLLRDHMQRHHLIVDLCRVLQQVLDRLPVLTLLLAVTKQGEHPLHHAQRVLLDHIGPHKPDLAKHFDAVEDLELRGNLLLD